MWIASCHSVSPAEAIGLAEIHNMKKIAIYIMRFGLSLIYAILKLFPTQKGKVLFLSRQSDSLSKDFQMLEDELQKQTAGAIRIVAICHRLEGAGGMASMIAFAKSTLASMYHLATSEVCVLDAYWPAVSILKHKKSLTVIQMWHALGKIKQSGYQTLGKESGRGEEIARLMKMHEGYDYIIAGGSAWNPFYCASFGTTEDKLRNYGLPRIDYLLATEEANRKKVLAAYPELAGKSIVLYAPTFRRGIKLEWEGLLDLVKAVSKQADEQAGAAGSDYALIIKGHPNQKIELDSVNLGDGETVKSLDDIPGVYTCPELTSAEILAAADYLITDYSAIAIEGAVLNKKTYYFVYDYEEYREKNGMNIDLFEVMPSCVFRGAGELIAQLKSGNYNDAALASYREKYLPQDLGHSTEKIAQLVIDNMTRR